MRACFEPAPDAAHGNGVRSFAFGPASDPSRLLTGGIHSGRRFARICGQDLHSVARWLPAAHTFGCMSFTL